MKNTKASVFVALIGLGICASLSLPAVAQTYPARAIRIIVGYAPGGPADISARLIAKELTDSIGKPVIVENKPGAAGTLAADIVAKGAPDGHTLLISDSLILMPSFFVKLPFDVSKDFVPLSLIAIGPSVLVANPSLSVSNVRELIALAKAKPGQLKYGSAGTGSMGHLMMGLLASEAGVQMVHVPYKGSTPAVVALMSGEVDLLFTSIAGVLPQIKAGKIKAYGLGLTKANESLPNTPTIDESGLPGYNASSWQGLYAPARTPKDILGFLSKEVIKVMRVQDLRDRFSLAGLDPVGNSPEEFAGFIEKEIPKWAKAIKAAGVEPQ